jgi:hypothetical protein
MVAGHNKIGCSYMAICQGQPAYTAHSTLSHHVTSSHSKWLHTHTHTNTHTLDTANHMNWKQDIDPTLPKLRAACFVMRKMIPVLNLVTL